MEKVRLGILGLGNMGSQHVRNILAGKCSEITVAAAADRDPARIAWAKETIGEDKAGFFGSAEEMIGSGMIDALLIAVPHYEHPKYAIMGMEHGLSVLTEKPAGVYTKQVREMMAAADRTGMVFGIMMNQRTNCIYRKMREIVKSGEMGQIRRTNWIITDWYRPKAYYESSTWRATWSGEGGGVLLNQCPHNLDLWQWICGMPEKITAHLGYGKWHDIEVEDDVTAFAEYANGATGMFITTTGDFPGTNRFEIDLEKGKLVAEGEKLLMWKTKETEPEFSAVNTKPFGHPEAEFSEVETDGENPQHVGVLNAFAAKILHGTDLVADGREGINGLLISNAMHLSSWTGSTVTLPFDEELFYDELMKRVAVSGRKENVTGAVAEDMSSTY